MKIETFTLRSNDTGGVAALRQVHPDCGGQNISPELSWVNAPEGTRSFAITMYDQVSVNCVRMPGIHSAI